MTDYLAYWRYETAAQVGNAPLSHAASNQFARVQPGDRLWIVTCVAGELQLLGRIQVDCVVDQQTAEQLLSTRDVWQATHHAIADASTAMAAVRLSLRDLASEIRFQGKPDRLTITDGRVNAQELQRLRRLDAKSAMLLATALGDPSIVPANATLPSWDDLRAAIASSGFGHSAMQYARDRRFPSREIDYKLDLARLLRQVHDDVLATSSTWQASLRTALRSPKNNILNWRATEAVLRWATQDPNNLRDALRSLWGNTAPQRVDTFVVRLRDAGITQTGQQLCLTSLLLMAEDPLAHPPVRTGVLRRALQQLGIHNAATSIGDRYDLFLHILDALIEFSTAFDRPLEHRLHAQGAVWCAIGGWKNDPPEDDNWTSVATDLHNAAAELLTLEDTERQAVVAARRGQGRYRNDLLSLWIGCAVTRCTTETLLRASHLKPWRCSTNQERLDRYNGLLLTPNLDVALDRRLISFNDDGTILIAPTLTTAETDALGIQATARLAKVHRVFFS